MKILYFVCDELVCNNCSSIMNHQYMYLYIIIKKNIENCLAKLNIRDDEGIPYNYQGNFLTLRYL